MIFDSMDVDIFILIISLISAATIILLLWMNYKHKQELKDIRNEIRSLRDMLQDDFINQVLINKDKKIKTGKGVESNILKSVLFQKGLENAGNIAEMKKKKLEREKKD